MSTGQQSTGRQWLDLITSALRDLGSVALGLWGIWHQQSTGEIRWELLIVYTTLLGVPGAAAVVSMLRGGGTTGQLSSPPSAPSESPSQSPSAAGGGEA